MTTNRNCKINFMTKEIIVSKKFLNASSNPISAECKLLGSLTQRYPDYRITLMPAPAKRNRPRNCTYEQMHLLISMQENAAELMEEFEEVRCFSRCQNNPYDDSRKWFAPIERRKEEFPVFVSVSLLPAFFVPASLVFQNQDLQAF